MWVQVQPELCPKEVPGMDDELLAKVSVLGGSFEEKISCVTDAFRTNARKLESLQTLFRRNAAVVENSSEEGGLSKDLPPEILQAISTGTISDSSLDTFDGQSFPLYAKEIVPGHEYCLVLEVHSGGSYWSGVSAQNVEPIEHLIETVTGSSTIIAQYGAAQRCAVFVWRWRFCQDRGPYNLPRWLDRVLKTDGNDPLRKLQEELAIVSGWVQQERASTACYVKAGKAIKDPYIREVLRLWPTEVDAQGTDQLKKCAWIEGLDSDLIVGRRVLVVRVPYDDYHSFALHATIAKRHQDALLSQETNPPYRLTTTWQWISEQACTDVTVDELQSACQGTAPTLLQGEHRNGKHPIKEILPSSSRARSECSI
jgi:hypothetical protein